jgi:hypothetical protein
MGHYTLLTSTTQDNLIIVILKIRKTTAKQQINTISKSQRQCRSGWLVGWLGKGTGNDDTTFY